MAKDHCNAWVYLIDYSTVNFSQWTELNVWELEGVMVNAVVQLN